MRICLVNFGYVINSTGGAEKVLCDLANEFSNRGHKVTVICSEDKEGMPFFNLDERVDFKNLGINTDGRFFIKAFRKVCKFIGLDYKWYLNNKVVEENLSKVLENVSPDIIINFFPKDLTYILRCRKKTPIIQMLHSSAEWLERSMDITIRKNLAEVDVLQVLLPSYIDQLKHLRVKNIQCIPNVVKVTVECAMYSKKIVYLTRYDRDKQIHILIDAFSKCANEFSDWVVNIYGTEWTRGYRDSLMKKIKSYNLGDRIFLYGRTERPISVLQDASICAFPSKYEGFPLSLTEAMSVGLPCIGFKSCTGVNEIIEDGVNGFLVEDGIDDFSYKLRILMKDKDVCIKFGQYSKRKMMQFNSLKIYNAWESLIINTVNNK